MYMAGVMGLVLESMDVEYILALAIIALGLMIQTAYRVLLGGADSHYHQPSLNRSEGAGTGRAR